jgi:hypothetical protein
MPAAFLRRILCTPYWPFYAALSTLFLVLGARAGAAIAGWIPFEAIPRPQRSGASRQAYAAPANGQRNLLVIGVDRLDGDLTRLESLWLVLYFPGRSPLTLMPLYPRGGGPETSQRANLAEAFSLARSGEPDPAFFERLQHEQVWWSGYVVLDETALAVLVDQLGGVVLDGKHLNGDQTLDTIPRAREDPQAALQGQVGLLRSACLQAGKRLSGGLDFAGWANALGRYIRSDLDVFELAREWLQAAGPTPTLECEFPLLDVP